MAGCASCFDSTPEGVSENRSGFACVRRIVDDSHFGVSLLRCPACGQDFVSVFCETVDWVNGNDPQDWLLIPLAPSESEALAAADEAGVSPALHALAPRRFLASSFPSTADRPEVRWNEGPVRLPRHD
jgi:hypothetical protein